MHNVRMRSLLVIAHGWKPTIMFSSPDSEKVTPTLQHDLILPALVAEMHQDLSNAKLCHSKKYGRKWSFGRQLIGV
jgi:hypothetical protein